MQIKTKVSYHFTCVRMTMIKKNTNNKYWQECGAMGTLVHFWWECELVQPGCKTVWRFLKKLKIEHMIQQFNPGVYPKHPKTVIWKYTCMPMFIPALLTIAKIWKQPKSPSTTEWIKMWHTHPHTQCNTQFSLVAQSCLTLCDPMNRSTPGLPVHHQLSEFTQTHVHRVSDAIQPSHPLSSPSPPAPNPSQHQSLVQWVNSSHEVAKVLDFQL